MGDIIGEYKPDNFHAGAIIPVAKATVIVAAGQTIKKHAPVKLNADGTVTPVIFIDGTPEIPAVDDPPIPAVPATTAAENTSAGLYGISAEYGEGGAEIVVYLTGEYFGSSLALEEDVTVDLLKTSFRNIGIFLKGGQE